MSIINFHKYIKIKVYHILIINFIKREISWLIVNNSKTQYGATEQYCFVVDTTIDVYRFKEVNWFL